MNSLSTIPEGKPVVFPTIGKHIPKRVKDLTGRKTGNLTVLGIHSAPVHSALRILELRGHRWVVECDCGNRETRSTKTLTTRVVVADRCYTCKVNIFMGGKDRF